MYEKVNRVLFSSFEKLKECSFEKSSSLINRKSTLLKRVVYVYQVSLQVLYILVKNIHKISAHVTKLSI